MRKLKNFKCPDNHIDEYFVNDDITTIKCSVCEKVAVKMLSAPRSFGNTTGKSPSMRY
jgi:hypothetical protein